MERKFGIVLRKQKTGEIGVCPLFRLCLLAVLVVGWFPSSARGQDITTGLVGHWKLDDGSGINTSDSSGNGYTGTLTNGPTWTTGKLSGAVDFDGDNDNVDVSGNGFGDIAQMSISMWIYPRSQGQSSYGGFFATAGACYDPPQGWSFGFEGGFGTRGEICFGVDYDGTNLYIVSAQNSVSLNQWQHITLTWDGSPTATNVHMYVDGSEISYVTQTSASGSRVADDGTNYAVIGDLQSSALNFDGLMDDVRIYNRALSAADVAALYSLTCSNPTGVTGKIVYNADFNVMQYCNGTRWKAMGPMPGAGGAGCSNPARATGSLLYNTTANVMQYCDGTRWKAMGPFPGAGGGGCSNPAGSTGSMVFNVDAAVIQYCDGANWVRTGS